MLVTGDKVPEARVWVAPRAEPVQLREALAGHGMPLLCFYLYNWSPT
jgi:hypothetical protein